VENRIASPSEELHFAGEVAACEEPKENNPADPDRRYAWSEKF